MKYADGVEVMVGDIVELRAGGCLWEGAVIGFTKEGWVKLEGVMVFRPKVFPRVAKFIQRGEKS